MYLHGILGPVLLSGVWGEGNIKNNSKLQRLIVKSLYDYWEWELPMGRNWKSNLFYIAKQSPKVDTMNVYKYLGDIKQGGRQCRSVNRVLKLYRLL